MGKSGAIHFAEFRDWQQLMLKYSWYELYRWYLLTLILRYGVFVNIPDLWSKYSFEWQIREERRWREGGRKERSKSHLRWMSSLPQLHREPQVYCRFGLVGGRSLAANLQHKWVYNMSFPSMEVLLRLVYFSVQRWWPERALSAQ